ncbi:acetyl-CoA carboxylase biotin carboxyl carrier protein [Clostridium paraputrificum]|uniref:acetyl-CoA carboxylase biotin carboxyl carrier protein n=1 Tax=Clostridium TaxID=1485 RepID=UPI003D331187
MDIKEVKELIEMINSSSLAYFELKTDDGHLKMDKSLNRDVSIVGESKIEDNIQSIEDRKDTANNTSVNAVADNSEIITMELEDDEDLIEVTSPMVGTFYGSPSPESHSFVKEGDVVNTGDTLCIIEAMKLMNEIESEVSGVIKRILVKEGDMVEYGQPLYKVKVN